MVDIYIYIYLCSIHGVNLNQCSHHLMGGPTLGLTSPSKGASREGPVPSLKLPARSEKNRRPTGWWYTYPSEKYEFVSWDSEIPNMMENKNIIQMFQATNQLKTNQCPSHFLFRRTKEFLSGDSHCVSYLLER